MQSHRISYGEILDPADGSTIDEVLLLFMAAPKTYTREDVIEIHCHGGPLVLRKILECALREGARLAEPGEFTKRAFLNGRIDLAQAEAVIETILAKTPAGLRVANEQLRGRLSREVQGMRETLVGILAEIEGRLDFPDDALGEVPSDRIEEDLIRTAKGLEALITSFETGKMLRDGVVVAIVGRTNVGKSSLLNALLGEEKAIVTNVAGTTRDLIEEVVSLSGILVRVVDTAGIRKWRNRAEKEGIKRTKRMIAGAALVLVMVDRSRPLGGADRETFRLVEKKKAVVVLNKMDLPERVRPEQVERVLPGRPIVEISARRGDGVGKLKEEIRRMLSAVGWGEIGEQTVIMEMRHRRALEEAQEAIERARAATGNGFSQDIMALEIRFALGKLGEIVGETVGEELLDAIFGRFCVGK